jgi:predicted ABC-type sugar transport system permease subunit
VRTWARKEVPVQRLNRVTGTCLLLALLLGATNGVLIFFAHIPVDVRLRPRTYFQAYGAAELLLAGLGLVPAALVTFLLYQRGKNDEPKAGRAAWTVSIVTLVVGVVGLLAIPRYLFVVGIFLIGACLSFSARESGVPRAERPPASKAAAIPH